MKSLESINAYIDNLSLRERVIVLLAAVLVLYGFWFLLWFNGASQVREATNQRIAEISAEQQKISAQIEQFSKAGGGTAEALAGELSRAQRELIRTDEQLSRSSSALVNADQLALVLQEMLAESSALSLMSMQTLPVAPISLASAAEADMDELADASINVYQHGVVLTVRGRYFEVLELLDKLEAKQWKFYWQSLRYEVQSYPEAEVQIRVFSLSAEEGLLGV
ncbi:type II secretion system protein GspM [Gilvimarinus japonicus]|jgi:MSHA biogenesis protein MshJ|uniref:Type II secretion system protein GspM n=1 Tax=Gilvimarinus japonicus TaxID=1796469 RepID=A0ABV7HPM9_9GAMM